MNHAHYSSPLGHWLWAVMTASTVVAYLLVPEEARVSFSASVGVIWLTLFLLPAVLGRVTHRFHTLALYQRDFGIAASLTFLLHGATALSWFGGMNLSYVFTRPIVLGFLADLFLLVVLATSSSKAHHKYPELWKSARVLAWAVPVFAAGHSLLARSLYFGADVQWTTVLVGTVAVIGFVIALYRYALRDTTIGSITVVIGLAALVTIGVYAYYNVGSDLDNVQDDGQIVEIEGTPIPESSSEVVVTPSASVKVVPL